MRVRMTSNRTGAVAWLRADNTPTDVITEAAEGLTDEQCHALIAQYRANLLAVTKHCRWTFDVMPDPVVTFEVHTGNPSWHQRKAGHASQGAMVYSGADAEREANAYAERYRKLHPSDPCYVQRRRA
ncbi:MAG TPA: hypothetical protein VJZ73_13400 [Methylomirabilota bacterium]|nr:hypothetical protein [Methylomirabilota bacterium]